MSEQITGRFGWFVNWLGQRRGGPQSGESSDGLDAIAFDPTEDADELLTEGLAAKHLAKHLRTAVEQLSSHERHVLLLHVNVGMTYWEIAGQLGVAEQAVLSDLSRAYSQLRVGLSVEELRGPHQRG